MFKSFSHDEILFLLHLTYRKTINGNQMNILIKDTLKGKNVIQNETFNIWIKE